MKQKGFADEYHNIAVYKIQKLFLEKKKERWKFVKCLKINLLAAI